MEEAITSLHWDFWTYFCNPFFWSGFMGWICAQTIKMTRGAITTKSLDFTYLMSTGGMPSAHSALVSGVWASLGLELGFDNPIAILGSVVATITVFDAATVRRAAGQQARLLNTITRQILAGKLTTKPLKEMLGHTRKEVVWGILTGLLVACIITSLFNTFHIFGWEGV